MFCFRYITVNTLHKGDNDDDDDDNNNNSNNNNKTTTTTPRSRVLLEKLTGFQILRNSPHFVETYSLPHLQQLVTCLVLSLILPVHPPPPNQLLEDPFSRLGKKNKHIYWR